MDDMNKSIIIKSCNFFSFGFFFQDSFTLLPKRDMSMQTEDSDDETSTLDSGFDNENVLVETLQSRFYESLKVFLYQSYISKYFFGLLINILTLTKDLGKF